MRSREVDEHQSVLQLSPHLLLHRHYRVGECILLPNPLKLKLKWSNFLLFRCYRSRRRLHRFLLIQLEHHHLLPPLMHSHHRRLDYRHYLLKSYPMLVSGGDREDDFQDFTENMNDQTARPCYKGPRQGPIP